MANPDPSRRHFLTYLTGFLLAVLGLLIAIPAVAYFVGPLRRRGSGNEAAFFDVGPLSEIPVGEWRLMSVELTQEDGWRKTRVRHSLWVRRQSEGDKGIMILSTICPHLGCPVSWHTDQSQFFCPCHGAIFDASGQRIAGPPPRGMDPLEHEVRKGRLWVRWQDFKIGVSDRIPVNV